MNAGWHSTAAASGSATATMRKIENRTHQTDMINFNFFGEHGQACPCRISPMLPARRMGVKELNTRNREYTKPFQANVG